MKRTRWFKASKEYPVRIGVYETKCRLECGAPINRLYWDGIGWLWPDTMKESSFGGTCDFWRGLLEEQ